MEFEDIRSIPTENSGKAPLRGVLLIAARSEAALAERLQGIEGELAAGGPASAGVAIEADSRAGERLAIDYGSPAELPEKLAKARKALAARNLPFWKALRAQGIFRGSGPAPKIAFLYPGQGSQYVNMLQALRGTEPIIANTFAEADGVMAPLLGKPLSEFIFVDRSDPDAVAQAEKELERTAITQPAVLAADIALTRLLAAYGIHPDMTMGHSLGEYAALVASGALGFHDALELVSARGREANSVTMEMGRMAAVFAPLEEVERTVKAANGYLVVANINSYHQAVIGGQPDAVEQAIQSLAQSGYDAVPLGVSNAFHTAIVTPYCDALRQTMERVPLHFPKIPVVANLDGQFYPAAANGKLPMVEILARQLASPVQFVKGLLTLYEAGARVFVEVGPKKALHGFAEDVLGSFPDFASVFTNHPKFADDVAFNQALCAVFAAGVGHPGLPSRTTGSQQVTTPVA